MTNLSQITIHTYDNNKKFTKIRLVKSNRQKIYEK